MSLCTNHGEFIRFQMDKKSNEVEDQEERKVELSMGSECLYTTGRNKTEHPEKKTNLVKIGSLYELDSGLWTGPWTRL